MSSEFAQYIGRPWQEDGDNALDCMAFVREIQARHFGVEMPAVTIPDYDDKRNIVALINGHAENENWQQVDKPQHGDAVLVRSPSHYGVWIDEDGGGVLHCVKGVGVVFTKDSAWAWSGFGRRQYMRHRSKL